MIWEPSAARFARSNCAVPLTSGKLEVCPHGLFSCIRQGPINDELKLLFALYVSPPAAQVTPKRVNILDESTPSFHLRPSFHLARRSGGIFSNQEADRDHLRY
ncbi:hypothetical protein DTO166G4_7445 [Paecilomyces variotii]|nr:hypothetical protein DTO166G4_7445 [Paecilomyces variotii]KAJ9242351.1 hypothetical protein DTO166G5_754 [Paecilomyces variotii]KAJ9353145.1 hypothetical protein DTO027B9_5397 [Paecilomyces variotii]KAJ9365734.1 hypothetical protein DTO280E4_30 [Paecilomyces variotii]